MLGRQRTQVSGCFAYNKTIVWRDGTPGISCARRLGEVRIRIISQQDCGVCFACFHRDRLCPISVSEVARCERLVAAGGWAGMYPVQEAKVHDMHPTTVGPARSLEPPLATRNVGQCHRRLLVSLHQLGGPLHSPLIPPAIACMGRMYLRGEVQRCMVQSHHLGNTVPSSATKRETRSTRTRRGFLPDGQAGWRAGVACGRITDDAQSLSRAPAKTHTPEHPPLLHLHCPLALDLDLDLDPSR